MEFNDKIPIYYQIKTVIYDKIISGALKPGEKLPAVRQLAVELTVNVNTVQRALSEMISEAVIYSQRGKGNFVTTDVETINQLKQELVTQHLATLYDQLHRLNISDEEILADLEQFMQTKGAVK
ncbi:GntR family transcriptional regulator [Secundilactobacillus similis]|jgi:DNA-binding transcriptional regulator YhcF (GntR family)|uniref:Transcriptional regulator n=1 Tax=Secundilactobacillus similis DSM 23365 = JCM 2765 TaxID=1423804 RepID=A0A0R2EZ93_9LACO|nr:GntR family transcriptional regulator [Secundilactobacillus similis]KRN21752.1 transcriptional regulator [Secundilactobacillus similis DSM 23365 = JCM 2765]